MNAGFRGTFVISVAQTEIDGICAAPLGAMEIGSVWRWTGDAARVDGPAHLLVLEGAQGQAELRQHASASVVRLLGAGRAAMPVPARLADPEVAERTSFTVTTGLRAYRLTFVAETEGPGLLAFSSGIPPRDCDLYVTETSFDTGVSARLADRRTGMICFAAGTAILTPEGPRPVEDIRPGDRVATRDNGPQEVIWCGRRALSGARLYAMPEHRPIRIRAGVLGPQRIGAATGADLIVSPDHRVLLTGTRARDLFNSAEVLATARDLVDNLHVTVEAVPRDVTYVHLLTEAHEILWANGSPTESLHPADADPGLLEAADRDRLLTLLPGLARDPFSYGLHARRCLSAPETAILRHVPRPRAGARPLLRR